MSHAGPPSSQPVSPDQPVDPDVKHRSRRSDIMFTIAIALAIYVAWMVRDVLVLLYVSALFAVVLMPAVAAIARWRIGKWRPGRAYAVLFLLLAAAAFLVLFAMFALTPVVRDMREFGDELPTRGPQLLGRIQDLPFTRHVNLAALNAKVQDFASNAATYLFLSIKNWAGNVFDIATGIVLTVYFLLEGESAYDWVLSFFPEKSRRRLDKTLRIAEVRMGKWLLGQGTLMLILGVASTIVFRCLHIRYAYALGVLMGLFNLIPIVGAMISMSLVLLVAAIDSWGRVLGVVIFYAIYAQVETSYLTPRIMKSSVDLAGLAVIVALLLGSALAGVLGAMVSVPTAVLVAVLLNEYLVKSRPSGPIAGPASR